MLRKIKQCLLEHINQIMLICGIGIILVIGLFGMWCVAMDNIVINEVCSNNFSVLKDDYSEYPDYIEIYNPSSMPIPLEGMVLSDSTTLGKYEFDNVWLEPKSFYIIYAEEKNGNQYTNFSLNRNGDSVYLFSRSGKIIDSVELPQLDYNTCFARVIDGENIWERRTATPGGSNNKSVEVVDPAIETVKFSKDGGFFEEEFYLTLEGPENGIIYYTLDGSEPTTDAECYVEPILITEVSQNENRLSARDDMAPRPYPTPNYKVDKAMVVRASVYDVEKKVFGKSIAQTYFIGYEQKEEYNNFPIISMVTDPSNLFDFEYGIYGNGERYQKYLDNGGLKDGEILDSYENADGIMQYLYMASNSFNDGREWEREVQIEYFNDKHENIFRQNVGIRTAGQSTRTRSQKSLNLYARDIYDENMLLTFDWNGESESWKTVKLRNGGNDSNATKIKDAFLHNLISERNISIQEASPYILFINGEYWGIYSLRERYKEEYVEKHFGVEEGDVWIINAASAENGKDEVLEEYRQLIDFMEVTDFTIEENYKALCELIDIQSFIDFYCINVYLGNIDVFFSKNVALWRSSVIKDEAYYDGKWRWMLYDLDFAAETYDENSFDENINGLMKEKAIKNILKNDEFRKRFYNTFDELANTCFRAQTVKIQLDEWVERYREQVLKTHRQFVDLNYTEEAYNHYVKAIYDFFEKRPEYIFDYMDEYMKLYE